MMMELLYAAGARAGAARKKGPAGTAGLLLLSAFSLSLLLPAASRAQADSVAPGAVAGLAAAQGASGGEIKLQWIAPGDDGAAGNIVGGAFRVHYATAPGMLDIAQAQLTRSTDMAAGGGQSFVLAGLEAGATYYAAVWTADEAPNWSGASNAAQAWAQLAGVSSPSAPGEFGGAAASTRSINWTWLDYAVDESGYRLRDSTGGIAALLNAGATFYMETGLGLNTSYYRYLEVYNALGSQLSPGATVYTLPLPSSGTYVMARSSLSVQLAWYANGNPEGARWGVQRSTDNFSSFDAVKAYADGFTALNWLDAGLTPHVTYYYRVLSYSGDGASAVYGAAVSTFTLSTPTAPGLLTGTALSQTSIWWTWTDSSDDEAGYRLRNSTGGIVIALQPNSNNYTKLGLGVNTAYQYYLEAYNAAGSAVTPSTSVYTLSMAPAGTYIVWRSSRSIQLAWYANLNPGGTKYGIERSTDNFAGYQLIKGWGDGYTSVNYTDNDLTPLVTYYYRVFSFNGYAFRSSYDSIISTFTLSPPAAPGPFTAATLSASAIEWSWADNSTDENGFRIKKPNGVIVAAFGAGATSYLETGLTPNTSHLYYVEAYNAAGAAVSESTAGYTLSMTPSGTYIVSRTSNSVRLAWAANGNPAGTRWGIQRSTDSFAGSQAMKAFADGFTGLNYLDTGLAAYTTYYYRVQSYNLAGVPSSYDAPISTFTISPPAAPGSFSGSGVSTGSIKWTWTDNAVDELGYLLKHPLGSIIAVLSPGATSYLETGLGVNTAYARYVETFNSAGTAVSLSTAVYTRTMKPSGTYVSARSRQSVQLAWDLNGNPGGITYWGVERSTDNFVTAEAVTTFGDYYTAPAYADTGLTPHVTYYYRVLSYNGVGYASAYDSVVSTFTLSTPTVPGSFSGAALSTGSIRWTWADMADDENGYRVKDTTGNIIASLGVNATSYLKTGLNINTSYFYLLETFNSAGWTATASTRVFTLSMKPAGTQVVAKTSYSVRLAWEQNGNSFGTRWGLERSTDNFALSQTLVFYEQNYTGRGYLDEGLAADTTYYFRALSYNGAGYPSAYDAAVATFTLSLPVAADGLAGSAPDGYSIYWTWNDNAFNEDGYRLKNSTGGVVASLPIGATAYAETGLKLNTAYRRHVEGYNTAGLSPSEEEVVFTLSAPPAGSYLMAVTSYSALLGWVANGNPGGTRWGIERSTNSFAAAQSIVVYDDAHAALTYLAGGLACATTYQFRVRSYNAVGSAGDFDGAVYVLTDPAVLPDTVPPSAVTDLAAQPGPAVGELLLSWTSPGDNWNSDSSSTATLKIRYKDIPDGFDINWAQITLSTALAPGAGRQYLLSGLTLGVTWYTVVWLEDHSNNWSGPSSVSTGLARTPIAPAAPDGFAGTVLGSGSVKWTWIDNASTEDGYRVRTSTGGLVAGLAAGATAWAETGLAVDTAYWRYAEVYNFTGTGLSSAASARTLAAVPGSFGFMEVYYSSFTLSWSANGNRADALYRLEYWQAHGSTSAVLLSTPAAGFTGLEESSTFYFRVGALNSDGVLSALDVTIASVTLTLPHISSGVPADTGATVELVQAAGLTRVLIPAGAFDGPVLLTLKTPLEYPPPGAGEPGVPAGAGLEILTDTAVQPSRPVTIIIAYRDTDIPGMRKERLAIGRYDPAGGRWALLPSFPDPAARTVMAYTGHFSLFRVFEVLPSQSVSSPWIFPNPFRPAAGHTLVTFSNLPAYARLKIYSIDGNKVRSLHCGASGTAYWDGKNSAGRETASGLYLVHTGLGSEFGIMKVVVQR